MSDKKMSLKRKIVVAIAALLAVASVFSLFIINKATEKINQGEISAIEETVPLETGQLFVAPGTEDWWKFISDISYDSSYLATINPMAENEGIVRIGYSQSLNDQEDIATGGALRMTYFEMETAENANALTEWLNLKKEDGGKYNVYQKGNLVALTPDWAFNEAIPFPEKTLGLDAEYIATTGASYRNEDVGYSYFDFETYLSSLSATQTDESSVAVLDEYLRYQFGLDDKGGIWTGNASKYNTLWTGTFLKGGFDASIIDPERAADILQGRAEVLDDNGDAAVIDPQESALLSDVAINVKNKSTETETIEFNNFFEPFNKVFEEAGFSEDSSLMRGAISHGRWNSTFSGLSERSENISTFLFAVKDNEMSFTFLRAEM